MTDAVDRIADAIKDAGASGAHLRIAVVTAVNGDGTQVQLDAFGEAWITTSSAVAAGSRVYALQQGPVVVVAGKLSDADLGGTPVGAVTAFAGGTAPTGWLLCQGQSLDREAYAALFAVVGTSYGSVSGTTFNLPDLRNRVPVGASPKTLGATGGAESVALTVAQMPAHDHNAESSHTHTRPGTTTVQSGTGVSVTAASGTSGTTGSAGSHTHDSEGSGDAHPNMQPYAVMNYIIKAD